jgi:hypothetical protein
MVCEGQFSPEDGLRYFQDFQKEASKVNPAQCQLYLDGSKLAVSASNSAEILGSCMKMYKDFGFEKVTINIGSNAILKMQVKTLASKVGFSKFELV